jgi:hypothetical protein
MKLPARARPVCRATAPVAEPKRRQAMRLPYNFARQIDFSARLARLTGRLTLLTVRLMASTAPPKAFNHTAGSFSRTAESFYRTAGPSNRMAGAFNRTAGAFNRAVGTFNRTRKACSRARTAPRPVVSSANRLEKTTRAPLGVFRLNLRPLGLIACQRDIVEIHRLSLLFLRLLGGADAVVHLLSV